MNQQLKIVLVRVWIAGTIAWLIAGGLFAATAQSNPFRSDDPHGVGLIAAIFAAMAVVVYYAVEFYSSRKYSPTVGLVVVVLAWCGFLMLNWFMGGGGEGNGLLPIFAAVTIFSAVVAWFVCFWSIPNWLAIAAIVTGAILVLLYCAVAIQYWLR
jgi:uncharacterized membrane protein (UPF0136 family)